MTSSAFAEGYRRTARVYRKRAAELRQKALPHGETLADLAASQWEAMAEKMDRQALELELRAPAKERIDAR